MAKGKAKDKAPPKIGPETRVLVLYGPELYLRKKFLHELQAIMEREHGHVEVVRFDGGEASLSDVLDELRGFSLMTQYKIVVVDDAEPFLRDDAVRAALERYMEKPVESATLVIRTESWRWPRLRDRAREAGAVSACEEPSIADAVAFCQQRCPEAHACEIRRDAANLLVELTGASLSRLDAELGRLSLMIEPGGSIDLDLIRREVGLSREEKAWQIQSAVLSGDGSAALAKVRELLEVSGHPPLLVNFALTDLARKLHGAARLLAQRTPERVIMSTLRLWGDSARPILSAARRVPPSELADLVRDSMNVDTRAKSGRGSDKRSLELLIVRFLATLHGPGR